VWAILQPLSLVFLYWFVFTFMIPARLPTGSDHYIEFLIAGLLPWLAINEGILRSSTAVVDNAAIVRRVPLRSELLVVVPNASALILELVGFLIFIVFLIARGSSVGYLWLLPLALLLQFFLQVGVGLIVAGIYVFVRDLAQILGFVLSIVFYLSPILYGGTGRFAHLFAWNPMTPLLGLFRSATLASPLPSAGSFVFLLFTVVIVFAAGLSFYRGIRASMADLI
jgi:ABC-type polysaccharide/polyol phosphate export permease